MGYVLTTRGQTVVFDVTHVSGCNYYRFFLRYTEDTAGDNMLLYQYDETHTTDFELTYPGQAGRSYTGNVYYRASTTGSWTVMGAQTVVVPSISAWDWTATADRRLAYAAITGQGKITNFKYGVWNELCAFTLDVLTSKSLSWSNTYATYANTLMTATDREMTAARFNAVLDNVRRVNPTGIAARKAGDKIMGSYFTAITTALNAVTSS